jgi:hypothetical protein
MRENNRNENIMGLHFLVQPILRLMVSLDLGNEFGPDSIDHAIALLIQLIM